MNENANSPKQNFKLWPLLFFLLLCLSLFLWLLGYAPFYAPSYLFWTGVIVLIIGLISIIRPLRCFFIFNRKIAFIVFCCGLLLSLSVMFWPVQTFHSEKRQQHLDEIMPEYSFKEYHQTIVHASPKKVMELVQTVSISDIPSIHCIVRLREIAAGEFVDKSAGSRLKGLQELREGGFMGLTSDSSEFVMGLIGQPHASEIYPARLTTPQFIAYKNQGYAKVAFNFVAKDLGNGQTLLSTETRVQTFDDKTSRLFSKYWTIIYPGSAIIRRIWLNAIAEQAEKK
jgi:hypothetical protein